MRRLVTFLLLLVVAVPAMAAPSAATQREIAALMDGLGRSDCRFNRNGSWHDAAAARAHLARKYEALRGRDAIRDTEGFIELAASRSSATGRPYLVQCGAAAPVESGPWFRRALSTLRAH